MTKRNAFTWIELIVVIAIIGFLVGLLLPAIHPKTDPLFGPVANGNLAKCKQIIEEGKVKPKEYPKQLERAASFGHPELVRYFVEDLKTPIDNKELIVYAVWGDNREIVDYLLEKGVPVDVTIKTTDEGWTLLHVAAMKGFADICETAIKKGANLEALNGNRETALEIAAEHGRVDIFHLLIDSGAKFDVKATNNRTGKTLLHYAASGGNGELCRFLLDRGADLNAKDRKGAEPIHDAAGAENPDACKVLMDAGANIDVKYRFMEGYDFAPVDLALYNGRTKTFKLLFKAGAKYDLPKKQIGSHNGKNVLMIAAAEGDVELGKILVDRGMDLKESWVGMSLLHFAARNGRAEFCHWLLENGAEVDVQNGNGDTPLLMAAARNHLETCHVLLDAGADPRHVNHKGMSSIGFAQAYKPPKPGMPDNRELLDLLNKYNKEKTPPSP